jgi:hypothetical protein
MTQFGKTFQCTERIIQELLSDADRSLHIVFTMNTLLNNRQFSTRMKQIKTAVPNEPNSIMTLSSQKLQYTSHANDIHGIWSACMPMDKTAEPPRVLVMCGNPTRFRDGVQLIRAINDHRDSCKIKRVCVYYDEIHSYINAPEMRKQIEEIHSYEVTDFILGLTATPNNIFTSKGPWSSLNVYRIPTFNDENYFGFRDMCFVKTDDYFPEDYRPPAFRDFGERDRQTFGFIQHILEANPSILDDGTYNFIPASYIKSGHGRVRDYIFSKNEKAVVIVLNGEEKSLQFNKDGNTLTIPLISDTLEVKDTISEILVEHELLDRSINVTGHLCIGMGQTLTSEITGSFTSAIIGHLDLKNDEIYQLFGRITGRTKHWDKYRQTKVFCPSKIYKIVDTMEDCSRNMAVNHGGEEVTRNHYLEPVDEEDLEFKNNFKKVKEPKEPTVIVEPVIKKFKTQVEIKNYFKETLKPVFGGTGPKIMKPREDGFYASLAGIKKSENKIQSTDDLYRHRNRNLNDKNRWRVYACYTDTSDKDTLEFWIIHKPI